MAKPSIKEIIIDRFNNIVIRSKDGESIGYLENIGILNYKRNISAGGFDFEVDADVTVRYSNNEEIKSKATLFCPGEISVTNLYDILI